MGELAGLVLRRTVVGGITLFLVVTAVFFFMRFAGQPLSGVVGEFATAEQVAEARARLGFDRPVIVQYADYLANVARGDFGASLRLREPAMALVLERLPATLLLAGLSIVIAILIAIPIGVYSALRPGSLVDNVARVLAVIGQSTPIFWLAILAMILFALQLRWLPTSGTGTWRHMVLPACTLALYSVPIMMRLTRSTMLEVLSSEHIMFARSKGLPERTVIIRHGLRNALVPVITVVALRFGETISGAAVLETVFSYPGLGRFAIQSMQVLDYPVIQAFAFLVAAMVIGLNLIVDILYGVADPRIRASRIS